MNKSDGNGKSATTENVASTKENASVKSKGKSRGKKRKRRNSDSSSDNEDVLAENSVEVDRNLHASAIKNNLDETSVRKIIKKVVTNDRVLALVKMREEEDSGPEEDNLRPKLTRAKVKELMKVSPKTHSTTAWNLESLELTPIKHIPVKTRPEVKALIAQELPEDEDDEEYEPTNDDVPSDDDQGLESCSDLDSQPRTPATPRSQHSTSPKVVKDGPFKVPQDISTPTRRKLDLEEEATIALRTRSKLSLSATSIEHIESTFIPPDDIPMPAVDDLWNQFLNECLNPASTSKNEDDDETDPEYNVAADPDAHDEDEESLGNSIIKISKKELNDLVTELFNIIPESTEEDLMADNLGNSVLTEHSQGEVTSRWEGKQEPLSDDENVSTQKLSDRITFEKKNYKRVSQGKIEPQDKEEVRVNETATHAKKEADKDKKETNERRVSPRKAPTVVRVSVQEEEVPLSIESAPPLLQENLKPVPHSTEYVHIEVNQGANMLPEQIQILQQQLRQHVQLATSSFLQLFVHPIHWSYASKYKEYLKAFSKMAESNPKSVVNVCNLKPAVDLITTWETTMSENTPENREMIQFIQSEADRCLRRGFHKNLYVGEFHETFKKVVANSPVFLYPYLLPSMPYRGDHPRRFSYLHSEDELIALGMEQFWKYMLDNPALFKPPPRRGRWGLSVVLHLVIKHMLPWLPYQLLLSHVQNVRKQGDKDNPINIYMRTRAVNPVKHKLLPYNPKLSLYEQPEHEVPRIWLRYLSKTSRRFRNYLNRRTNKTGVPAYGVDVELGEAVKEPSKPGLPIDFTKPIVANKQLATTSLADKFDIQITDNAQKQTTNLYRFVETSTGAYLVPLTMTVNSNCGPITTPTEMESVIANNLPETSKTTQKNELKSGHCTCCVQLRKICKQRQTVITDYFGKRKENICGCKDKRYPKVSNRLRLLVNNHKYNYRSALQELQAKIDLLRKDKNDYKRLIQNDTSNNDRDLDDIVFVTNFYLKLISKTALAAYCQAKRRVYNLLAMFKPYEHDPLHLAAQMEKACGAKCEDLYKEFLCFLTPEQADKIDAFKDYFKRNCITDLIKKVEEQVTDLEKRLLILKTLNTVFSKNFSTACEICTDMLCTLDGYPTLAQYVFSLFPHRKENTPEVIEPIQELSKPPENPPDVTHCNDTVIEEPNADYEADMSMSEEEDNGGSKSHSDSENNKDICRPIKEENTSMEYLTPTSESVSLVVTVSKTEVQDYSECSNSSMQIMFEDEMVKTEVAEWKRDEDKLILEILKEHLTPEERRGKTILEIVEEKNIIGMISDSLTHKTEEEIGTRILYLLQIC